MRAATARRHLLAAAGLAGLGAVVGVGLLLLLVGGNLAVAAWTLPACGAVGVTTGAVVYTASALARRRRADSRATWHLYGPGRTVCCLIPYGRLPGHDMHAMRLDDIPRGSRVCPGVAEIRRR